MTAKSKAGHARPDRRYKNPDAAPPIVSEKRLTFFLPDETFRALRLQTGYFQVNNAEGEDTDDPLPETPSALVREAIDLWLDQFRATRDRLRSEDGWADRLTALRAAIKKRR